MDILRRGFNRIRSKGLIDTIVAASDIYSQKLSIAFQNREYYLNPRVKKNSKLPKRNDQRICEDFRSLGIQVVPCRIDIRKFHDWVNEAQFPSSFIDTCNKLIWPDFFTAKALEYYVSASLLKLDANDTLIDVGAMHSPWQDVTERIYGCASYALDLSFAPGVHGKKIGADATEMPLPNGFATKIALQDSYMTFEGSADQRFLHEAYRVLQDTGKMVILPLYVDNAYYVILSPYASSRRLDLGGAEVVWDDCGWEITRYGAYERLYSVAAFNERVVANLSGFELTVYYVENAHLVSPNIEWPRYYTRFVALFEKEQI